MQRSLLVRGKNLFTLTLVLLAALVYGWGLSPARVEQWYVAGLFPTLSLGLRKISSLFPVSLGDLCYAVLVLWFVVASVRTVIHLKRNHSRTAWTQHLLAALRSLLIFYLLFKLCWGLNYDRLPVYRKLQIGNAEYTARELSLLGDFILRKTNEAKTAAATLPELKWEELKNLSILAYRRMENRSPVFRYSSPSIKQVTSSTLISFTGIEGYYNPLTAEATVNTGVPAFVLPFVTCHEIAHQTGIAYEDEANLLGYLTAVNSADPRFRYAAYYQALRYILLEMALRADPAYLKLKARISPAVLADFRRERVFWERYNGQVSAYMSATFDQFLKLNDQQKGIKSYQDIVVWLWNVYAPALKKRRPALSAPPAP